MDRRRNKKRPPGGSHPGDIDGLEGIRIQGQMIAVLLCHPKGDNDRARGFQTGGKFHHRHFFNNHRDSGKKTHVNSSNIYLTPRKT